MLDRFTHNIILRLPPVESLDKNWQDVAAYENVDH